MSDLPKPTTSSGVFSLFFYISEICSCALIPWASDDIRAQSGCYPYNTTQTPL